MLAFCLANSRSSLVFHFLQLWSSSEHFPCQRNVMPQNEATHDKVTCHTSIHRIDRMFKSICSKKSRKRQYTDSFLTNTQFCYANLNKVTTSMWIMRHFVLPVRCEWDLCSSGMLCSVDRHHLSAPSSRVQQSKKNDENNRMGSYMGNRVGWTLGGLGIQIYFI